MQGFSSSFLIFFYQIALGGLCALACAPFREIERAFYKSTAAVLYVFALIGVWGKSAFYWQSLGERFSWSISLEIVFHVSFVVSFSCYMFSLWGERQVFRARSFAAALLTGLGGLVLSTHGFYGAGIFSVETIVYPATFFLSALLLGSVTVGMLIGHWYLIDTGQSLAPFIRIFKFFVVTLIMQCVVFAIAPTVLHFFGSAEFGAARAAVLPRLWIRGRSRMISEPLLRRWVRDVREGRRTPRSLIDELKHLPFDDVGIARLDTHRRLRRGLPEMVFCEGKTPAQLIRIIRRITQARELVLLTRLNPQAYEELHRTFRTLRYDPIARLAYQPLRSPRALRGLVVVMTGGTSDLPVAEEAALTAQLLGSRVARLYDVGVAGVHRLLAQWRLLQRARVIIAIAGMEGALASVAAGLVRCPVLAVPTSIGYGASFQGIAPLLTMLNSCVPGIGVVNIDNGFGAAYLAHVINQPPHQYTS